MEIKNIDENIEELKTDRTTIEIEYIGNKEGISMEKSLPINREIIKDIIENKIEIESNETFRFIYTKTLADIIESITALCYNTSLFNNFSIEESFNFSSIFLKESNILISEYKENISKITENSIKNLLNPKCKFKENQRDKFFEVILENKKYNFKNKELVYQAMTHPSSLTEENIEKGNNYVNKSYQRLAFLGEAIVELFVSIFVYENNKHDSEESLHKMRICGINHHMISLMAINLNLHQCLLKNSSGIKNDVDNYIKKLKTVWNSQKDKFKIPEDEIIDEEFVIILCELFHSYIGAIFVDSGNIEKTFDILKDILNVYLLNNATKDTYTEHPKVEILQEYQKRKQIFKRIKENGGNRIIIKYGDKNKKYRENKNYEYQLIIDKYIIYSENIAYNRSTIKKAQKNALQIFKKICKEVDRRLGLRLNESKLELKKVMDYIGITYKEIHN